MRGAKRIKRLRERERKKKRTASPKSKREEEIDRHLETENKECA